MTLRGGWAGRILVVELTEGRFSQMDTMAYAREYVGGRGLAAALSWEMLRPNVGPFDPESPLMFLNGPLAGTSAPASGRVTICSTSPQGYPISWFSRASMGGDWGRYLKYTGHDGIIFLGRAPQPVYLWLSGDGPELRDAHDLWGLGIMATQDILRKRLGPSAQIATIGPAGETLSRIATIGTNEGSAAGQCGFGAVMGYKNLKAVAVHGTKRPGLADPEGFRALVRAIAREHIEDMRRRSGHYPSRTNSYGPSRDRCSIGCIRSCRRRYEGVPGTVFPDSTYGGVVQCTAGRFSGADGHYWNHGFEAGFELNMIANDWGINHWDLMKGLFPWIGMCYREGLMQDLGGRPIELDEPRFWYDVLGAIATREGPMAEVVADGGRRAIARTGLLPEIARQLYTGWGYANHWDGRGPRGNRITYPFWLVSALLWMVETRDPMGSTHGYVQHVTGASPIRRGILSWEKLKALGARLYGREEAVDPLSDYAGKAEPALWHTRRSMMKDSLPLCDLIFPRIITSLTEDGLPRIDGLEGPDLEYHLYSLATGDEIGPQGLERSAERALALERAEQIRDFGRDREMERGVLDFFCETTEEYLNPLLDERKRAEREPLQRLADEFYVLRGWDPTTGAPTAQHLRDLGLGDVADEMTKKGSMADELQPASGVTIRESREGAAGR